MTLATATNAQGTWRDGPSNYFRPVLRFRCYVDDARAFIVVDTTNARRARELAADHFECDAEAVIARYVITTYTRTKDGPA